MRAAGCYVSGSASRGVWGISEEGGLSGGGIRGKEGVEEVERGLALTLSGDHEAGDDTLGERPVLGACAEGNLAHDDWGAERLFGLVISGRDVGHSQEREEAVDVRDHDAAAECFGGLIVEGLSGERAEPVFEARDESLGLFQRKTTGALPATQSTAEACKDHELPTEA